MSLPATIDAAFNEFLQELPSDYVELAYEFKAFCYAKKFRSPAQLFEVILLYCGLDLSLRECAGKISEHQGYISDTGVQKRLKACVPWVKAILSKLFGMTQLDKIGNLRFIVIDGSTVQAPGAKGIDHRLHIAIDLIKLEILEVKVTDDKVGEGLEHYNLQNGDVVLLDRGYNQPKSLVPFIDNGGSIVLRYNPHGMNLYSQDKEMAKINWGKTLKKHKGEMTTVPVYLCHNGKRVKGIVHCIPLPEKQAAQARERTRANSQKKGHQLKADTLYLSGWVLILTTLPTELLDTQAISDLYRVRWQIEIFIKRLKSILNIDCLRARQNSSLAELYLYGKLINPDQIENGSF